MGQKAEVWYLGHSGFCVGIGNTLLIFDYYLDDCTGSRSLKNGVINPEEIQDRKVLIFSSHRHPDHFNPVILSWKEKLPDAEYFLSSDIQKRYHREWTNLLKPYQIFERPGLRIQTFKSTDEGVAFLVTLDGLNIYHAGDLNWWYWEEESKAWNGDMEARFKHEVDLIKDSPIDIAFLTADPRLEASSLLGASYFLDKVKVKTAFPMHFGNDYSIMDEIASQARINPMLGKLKVITARGDHFT